MECPVPTNGLLAVTHNSGAGTRCLLNSSAPPCLSYSAQFCPTFILHSPLSPKKPHTKTQKQNNKTMLTICPVMGPGMGVLV